MEQTKFLKMFYASGAIIFLIVGVANAITNIQIWNMMLLSAKISAVFSDIFNFLISLFFFNLLKETRVISPLSREKIEEAFKKHK